MDVTFFDVNQMKINYETFYGFESTVDVRVYGTHKKDFIYQ